MSSTCFPRGVSGMTSWPNSSKIGRELPGREGGVSPGQNDGILTPGLMNQPSGDAKTSNVFSGLENRDLLFQKLRSLVSA